MAKEKTLPKQKQSQPGKEHKMEPRPKSQVREYKAAGKLTDKIAILTGADSENFGKNTIMGRPGEPDELAPCYVFLACEDSSYMTGQVLHPNGGRIVNT